MVRLLREADLLDYIVGGFCNENDAYHFNKNRSTSRIGHLLSLSFPEIHKTLISDITVCDPESPTNKKEITGAFSFVMWQGKSLHSPITIEVSVSHRNKAIFQEALCFLRKSNIVKIEWAVYEFDPHTKRYFKRIHTTEKPLVCALTTIDIKDEFSAKGITEIQMYTVRMNLIIKTQHQQTINYAFSSTGTQFTRILGVKEAETQYE